MEDNKESSKDESKKPEKVEMFPMFSGADKQPETLIKVDLDNNAESNIVQNDEYEAKAKSQKRPESYYFARWSPETETEIQESAVSGDDILKGSKNITISKFRVIDLNSYNARIQRQKDAEKMFQEKRRRNRPGKKRREAKIRASKARKLREAQERKKKAINRKKRIMSGRKYRGKNKKRKVVRKQSSPKFRTE